MCLLLETLVWVGLGVFLLDPTEAKLPAEVVDSDPNDLKIKEQAVLANQNLGLTLTATPEIITDGLTDELEVKCQYNGTNALMALGIGKTRGGHSRGLAYLSSTSNGKAKSMGPDSSAEIDGQLDIDGKGGYLAIKWKSPSEDNRGEYECLVNTMIGFKEIKNERRRVEVDAQPVTLQNLLKFVKTMKTQSETNNAKQSKAIKHLEEALAEERQSMTSVLSALFTQSSEYNGRTYFITEYNAMTYLKSHDVCRALGGYLAEIDDKEEYEFVKGFAVTRMSRRSIILLAGNDVHQDGVWMFRRTNQPMKFFDWIPGQPNNSGGGQDCMSLQFSNGTVRMNDMKCHSGPSAWNWVYGFICEVPKKVTHEAN